MGTPAKVGKALRISKAATAGKAPAGKFYRLPRQITEKELGR
jgi:hypothetical protein